MRCFLLVFMDSRRIPLHRETNKSFSLVGSGVERGVHLFHWEQSFVAVLGGVNSRSLRSSNNVVQWMMAEDKYPNRRALTAQRETLLYGCDPADTRIHPTRRQKPDKSHGIFAHSHKRTTEACLLCTSVPVCSQPATRVQ